jgi:hypothetical protein
MTDLSQTIDSPAFLVDADEWKDARARANGSVQFCYLLWRFDIPVKEDDSSRLYFVQELSCRAARIRSGEPDEKKLTDALFKRHTFSARPFSGPSPASAERLSL